MRERKRLREREREREREKREGFGDTFQSPNTLKVCIKALRNRTSEKQGKTNFFLVPVIVKGLRTNICVNKNVKKEVKQNTTKFKRKSDFK